MWQPHTKVNTQRGKTVSESWWTLLWCLWRPPTLPGLFPLGFSLFSALKVPRDDHTSKDSQQSVVHHERAPPQELEEDRYPMSRCTVPVHTLLRVTSSRTRFPCHGFSCAGRLAEGGVPKTWIRVCFRILSLSST